MEQSVNFPVNRSGESRVVLFSRVAFGFVCVQTFLTLSGYFFARATFAASLQKTVGESNFLA